MSHCRPGCRTPCMKTHSKSHSWTFTRSLNAKEQMLCNFLFSTETIASTPSLTRPLSPALHERSLAGKYVSGPPSLSHRAEQIHQLYCSKISFKKHKTPRTACCSLQCKKNVLPTSKAYNGTSVLPTFWSADLSK